MATWQNTGITILRTMLNDSGCNNTYTDKRLEELLITSAYFLPVLVNFATEYSINVETKVITPDPIDSDDGSEFINFMVLKAACIADEGAFRNAALLQGVTARLGPATIQTSAYGTELKELLSKGPCGVFDSLVHKYNFSYDGRGIIRAILSPFVSNDYDPNTSDVGSYLNLERDRN